MSIAHVGRCLVLTFFLAAGQLMAAAEEPPPCQFQLVSCNIGYAYSGTFHFVSVVETAEGKTTEDVTAHVMKGQVRCEGSIASTDGSTETGPIKGDGLLVVEWGVGVEEDRQQPWQRIAVACPSVGGSSPARMNGSEMNTYRQRRTGFSLLKGSIEEEHPDADAANGVTGKFNMSWSLSREAGAKP